ncbi:50S ribosomal protein L20 [Striga asiatica]|uniref:50S ribosomal protein L20 n=1 Tax=Striga asiatica TaxID=4170 RepID=A0A5A7PZ80_STRAF|nr:50S ribosomal protein L20 [Striga asiatica]
MTKKKYGWSADMNEYTCNFEASVADLEWERWIRENRSRVDAKKDIGNKAYSFILLWITRIKKKKKAAARHLSYSRIEHDSKARTGFAEELAPTNSEYYQARKKESTQLVNFPDRVRLGPLAKPAKNGACFRPGAKEPGLKWKEEFRQCPRRSRFLLRLGEEASEGNYERQAPRNLPNSEKGAISSKRSVPGQVAEAKAKD